MKHRLTVLTAVAAVALSGGCGILESATAGPTAAPTTAPGATVPSPTGSADSGLGSVKDAGDIPDPCTLLGEAEVRSLTGRNVTRVDEDGGDAGDITRFCQWQQDGGQLAVFLSRTTPADFQVTVAEAEAVDGVGEDAFRHSGHLYVLQGTVQVDVYARGGSEAQNLADAKQIAEVLRTRI